jgi:hypothetical protein
MRETVQVGDDIQMYDLALLLGEATKVSAGTPGTLTVISPWISNVAYYLGSSGLMVGVPAIAFGRSDIVRLLDFVRYLLEDHRSQVQLATLKPSPDKYSNDLAQLIWELRFLLQASEYGARTYFYSHEGDVRKIMHPKFLLTSLGVVFGSFNFTKSGRYWNIEDGNYSSALSPVYFEKKQRVEEIIAQCQEATVDKIKGLLSEFGKLT